MSKKVQESIAHISNTPRELHSKLTAFVDRVGGLMHALNWLMKEYGFIESSLIPIIADVFNLSQAEVRGVISFYHDFKTEPAAAHQIKICQAEACQSLGARKLTTDIETKFGTELGSRTADNRVQLEAIYCLGLCAVGPAIQVNGRLVARAKPESIKLGSE